jgi:hypothetical protein
MSSMGFKTRLITSHQRSPEQPFVDWAMDRDRTHDTEEPARRDAGVGLSKVGES